MENKGVRKDFLEGFRDGIPIALGYLSVSFAYGIMAQGGGLSLSAAVLISMTNLTSAGQIAGTQLIFASASYIEMIMTTLVINLRYMLMSLMLSQRVDEEMTTPQRLIVSFGITDEIFAVAYRREQPPNMAYMLGLIFLPYIGWAAGTLLGGAAGFLLPAGVQSALGIAIYGMLTAIVVPVCKHSKPCLFAAATAGAISCCIKYIPALKAIPSGWAIIICAAAASAAAALLFPIKAEEGKI